MAVVVVVAAASVWADLTSSDEGGGYSMAGTQLTGQRGLLYVTDYASHRALVYEVNIAANTVAPQQPIDLRKLFNE